MKSILTVLVMLLCCNLFSQQITKEQLIAMTPAWKGERFTDGRPKVPDSILDRMKLVTLEEAWAVLRNANSNTSSMDNGKRSTLTVYWWVVP